MSVRSSKSKSPSLSTLMTEAGSLGIAVEPRSTLHHRIKAAKAAKEAAEKRPVIEKDKALRHASSWHSKAMEAVKTATVDQLKNLRQVLVDWRRDIDTHTGDDYTSVHAKWQTVFTGLIPAPKPAPKAEPKGKKAKGKSKATPKAKVEAPVVVPAPEPAVSAPGAEPAVEVPDLAAENAKLKARIAELEAALKDAKEQWITWQTDAEKAEAKLEAIAKILAS